MRGVRAALLAVVAISVFSAEARAVPLPFGVLTCLPKDDVRSCEGSLTTRVPSFDGVPLDTSVVLPLTGDENLPLMVVLPAWSAPKKTFEEMRVWAKRGYAVLSYSPRGFHLSCGTSDSRTVDVEGCQTGWLRMADVRREVRDTQHLVGRLVDEGLVNPGRIGVTGTSYGGGQSLMLATLRDRTVLADGQIVPWTSPGGKPLRIAGAAVVTTWSNFAEALVPTGRTLDYAIDTRDPAHAPVGVVKDSFTRLLFDMGRSTGFYAPSGIDPESDVALWEDSLNAGEPYAGTGAEAGMRMLAGHHSALGVPLDRPPAPVFLVGGWTDDVMPVSEMLRYANAVRAAQPASTLAMMHLDHGHGRALSKAADVDQMRRRIDWWLDHYVARKGRVPQQGVEIITQTCPKRTPSAGPFHAASWAALHPGEVRATWGALQVVGSGGGNPETGAALDPTLRQTACVEIAAGDDPGAATYRLAATPEGGFTLAGSPTVIADLDIDGAHPQLAFRLWDVRPDGTMQRLVSRGIARPDGSGRQVFQLHPAAWRFEPGHAPKLEILGADPPFARRSNGTFSIGLSDLELRLPVMDAPTEAGPVRPPAPHVVPPGYELAP